MKIIKDEKNYNTALLRIEDLIDIDPEPGTDLAEEMDLLILLINKYENSLYKIDLPDPIDAIKFRMEQQGLKYSDMAEYFGNKSKVSEVLGRKRTLSLSMIRKLNKGLGISAEVLIADPFKTIPEEITGLNWNLFPVAEMIKKEWIEIPGTTQFAKEHSEEIIRSFFNRANYKIQTNNIFFRKGLRSDSIIDEYALSIWYAKALIEQENIVIEKDYLEGSLSDDFLDEVKRLSIFEEGPLLAQKLLLKVGIKLVIVPHLSGTHIDGAVFKNSSNTPVICLTLRYDRVDYFWFTLFHELAHLKLHLNNEMKYFFDDLKSYKDLSKIEKEADIFAEEKLISKQEWESFYSEYISEDDVHNFAEKCRISSAIAAGRIQKERKDYRIFRNLPGQKKVKELFVI
jgi:HTH-type transcriptional regulator / antitoxin HigA